MAWKDKLKEMAADEKAGRDAYKALADEAEAAGCCREAGVLRDMAREEQIHHDLLHEMM